MSPVEEKREAALESSFSTAVVRFGPYVVDRRRGEVWKYDQRIKLSGQPFEVLNLLLDRPGELVTREELRQRLWTDDVFVDFERSLNSAVKKLRRALNEDPQQPRYIETYPRKGYRFIGVIEQEPPSIVPSTAPNAENTTLSTPSALSAMHTQNLQADPRASLLITQPDTEGEPLGASRVTLLGNVLPVPKPELAEARKLYLQRHANSKYWVDFEDFSFYRMDVVDVYYVGGFGVMGWVSASDYYRSQPDPLADSIAQIIQHMNADHKDALVMLARSFAHIDSTEATMTTVDRLGFHVRLKTAEGMRGARIAFLREVGNQAETRKALVEMVQQARAQVK